MVTTDGPFAETKGQLGGFWIIKVIDLDAALDWAAKELPPAARRWRSGRSNRPRRSRSCRLRRVQPCWRAYRRSSGRAIATLVRLLGDIGLAEVVREAFLSLDNYLVGAIRHERAEGPLTRRTPSLAASEDQAALRFAGGPGRTRKR